MFKVKNKDTRTTPIVNFEQVNAGLLSDSWYSEKRPSMKIFIKVSGKVAPTKFFLIRFTANSRQF